MGRYQMARRLGDERPERGRCRNELDTAVSCMRYALRYAARRSRAREVEQTRRQPEQTREKCAERPTGAVRTVHCVSRGAEVGPMSEPSQAEPWPQTGAEVSESALMTCLDQLHARSERYPLLR